MKNYILLCLLFPIIMLAQNRSEKQEGSRQRKVLFDVNTSHKNFRETLSFQNPHGMIIIPVVIEGHTYNFLFDTGAVTVISRELLERFNFEPSFNSNISDAAGAVKELGFYTIPTLQLGAVRFDNVTAATVDLGKFEKMLCVKLDGVFGTNIMRLCNWKIDYKNSQLTFSDKKIKPEWKATTVKFAENYSGSPMLLQYIAGKSFYSTLDTGSNGGISLSDSIYFKSRKAGKLKAFKSYGKSSMTALSDHDDTVEHIVVIDSIYIGDRLFKNRMVDVQPEGLLTGNGFLKEFDQVVIDWIKKRIYLPDVEIRDDNTYNTFGINFQREDDRVFVGTVWEGSLAQELGIKVGDVILFINDISTIDITQEAWCELFEVSTVDNAAEIALTIQTIDGSLKTFKLTKYNLLE